MWFLYLILVPFGIAFWFGVILTLHKLFVLLA